MESGLGRKAAPNAGWLAGCLALME